MSSLGEKGPSVYAVTGILKARLPSSFEPVWRAFDHSRLIPYSQPILRSCWAALGYFLNLGGRNRGCS